VSAHHSLLCSRLWFLAFSVLCLTHARSCWCPATEDDCHCMPGPLTTTPRVMLALGGRVRRRGAVAELTGLPCARSRMSLPTGLDAPGCKQVSSAVCTSLNPFCSVCAQAHRLRQMDKSFVHDVAGSLSDFAQALWQRVTTRIKWMRTVRSLWPLWSSVGRLGSWDIFTIGLCVSMLPSCPVATRCKVLTDCASRG
jgi:hypothetical protein